MWWVTFPLLKQLWRALLIQFRYLHLLSNCHVVTAVNVVLNKWRLIANSNTQGGAIDCIGPCWLLSTWCNELQRCYIHIIAPMAAADVTPIHLLYSYSMKSFQFTDVTTIPLPPSPAIPPSHLSLLPPQTASTGLWVTLRIREASQDTGSAQP